MIVIVAIYHYWIINQLMDVLKMLLAIKTYVQRIVCAKINRFNMTYHDQMQNY